MSDSELQSVKKIIKKEAPTKQKGERQILGQPPKLFTAKVFHRQSL